MAGMTDRSGAVVAADTSELVMAARAGRRFLLLQNVSDTDQWFNFGADATKDQPSLLLEPGALIKFDGHHVPTDKVTVICSALGKAFTAKEA